MFVLCLCFIYMRVLLSSIEGIHHAFSHQVKLYSQSPVKMLLTIEISLFQRQQGYKRHSGLLLVFWLSSPEQG